MPGEGESWESQGLSLGALQAFLSEALPHPVALLLSDAAGPWCSRESADFCPLSSLPESRLSLFSDFKNAFLSPFSLLDTHDYVIYGLRFLKRSEEPLISYVHAFSSVKIPKVRNYKGPSFLLETERREKTGRLGKLEF